MTATSVHYHREGFTILPTLLSGSEVSAMSDAVVVYLQGASSWHTDMMNGKSLGGWYIADFPWIAPLNGMLDVIRGKPRLRDALRDLLGNYRLLSRSEVYVDRRKSCSFDRSP